MTAQTPLARDHHRNIGASTLCRATVASSQGPVQYMTWSVMRPPRVTMRSTSRKNSSSGPEPVWPAHSTTTPHPVARSRHELIRTGVGYHCWNWVTIASARVGTARTAR